jgi:hypothetical protein
VRLTRTGIVYVPLPPKFMFAAAKGLTILAQVIFDE